MPRTSRELRRAFLEFFAARGHEVVPSAPIVPQHDPTLMFVNAGMVQFKDVFTGKETRATKRACSAQKCIRISGKHNDLENVGVTARHHTFFEMLGNFSFGDYFKEEAIVHAWELLTRELGVPKDRLMVTVFGGAEGFAADDEAAALWRKLTGFGDERIRRLGMDDNFWTMGATGPCGPCSEIHFHHGGPADYATFGTEPGGDGRGWTEIWNLVFMQYDRAAEGAVAVPLPAPSIDTGAGLERLAGVVQGKSSNYDTDLLRGLIAGIEEVAGKRYTGGAGDDDVSMRVIADHARTTAFLVAEGVLPERQKREYVLRRVMRRAIRHGHRLGIERPFFHEIAGAVVTAMAEDHPELVARRELIERVCEGEEARFRTTLRRGIKILDEHFGALAKAGAEQLSAPAAADLYTTFGFPLDLTEVICREHGVSVDTTGAREIVGGEEKADGPIDARAALDPAYRDVAHRAPRTTFTGYDVESGESEVVAIVRHVRGADGAMRLVVADEASAGDEVEVATSATPFYAEAGGQTGDTGLITGDGLTLRVTGTQRHYGEVTLHRARVESGRFAVGAHVRLEVDHARRTATRRNHSATHLLHWALRKVLGEHAQQKGSLVGADVLRFDFTHNQALTPSELCAIEDFVNAKILSAAPVVTEVLPIAEARKTGAMAIFEEKYGEFVRVLTMTSDSVELCGGTHCASLGQIGLFKIVSEGGIAAGVRRILAATGTNALEHVRKLDDELRRSRLAAKASGGDLAERIDKMVAREKQLDKRVKELEKELLEGGSGGGGVDAMLSGAQTIAGVRVLAVRVPDGTNMAALRELAEKLRDMLGDESAVLAACKLGDKAQLVLTVSKAATARLKAGSLIKPVAAAVGGSGGGRPDMAQAGGTNPEGLDDALSALYREVSATLGA